MQASDDWAKEIFEKQRFVRRPKALLQILSAISLSISVLENVKMFIIIIIIQKVYFWPLSIFGTKLWDKI